MNIKTIMDNENNMYYGHGTGDSSMTIINSILNHGLRCSHGSLYYTSIALCMGKDISDETVKLMKNWPHKSSNIVIIVSLPNKYNILDAIGIGTYNCANAAFYYTPSKEQQKQFSLTNSSYVMPEFIKGYYDSSKDKFVSNPRYYEFLSHNEQEQLFEQVKLNYINVINNGCGIEKYHQIIDSLPDWEFPLTTEDIEKAKKTNFSNIYKSLNINLEDNRTITIAGKEIEIEQYIWQYVYPYLPSNGIIIMKDDTVHLVNEFIENYVLKECLEKYNGDVKKYLFEKTKNNLGATKVFYTSMMDGSEENKIIFVDDILNNINEDLLNTNIVLFNGISMTVKEYIQNIYLPYIPQDGKVYLKDGSKVSIKKFIEEYLIRDGKISYGGDIYQILSNLTYGNDGFVVTDNNVLIQNIEEIKSSLENLQKEKELRQDEIEEFEFDEDFGK